MRHPIALLEVNYTSMVYQGKVSEAPKRMLVFLLSLATLILVPALKVYNRIGGVMVSLLASSAVDRAFES
jgi:hypothetical protein